MSIDTIMPGGPRQPQTWCQQWTRNRAQVKVGSFSYTVRVLSHSVPENQTIFTLISPFLAICNKQADWSNLGSRQSLKCNQAPDWSGEFFGKIVKNSKNLIDGKKCFWSLLSLHPFCSIETICGLEPEQFNSCLKQEKSIISVKKSGSQGLKALIWLSGSNRPFLSIGIFGQVIKNYCNSTIGLSYLVFCDLRMSSTKNDKGLARQSSTLSDKSVSRRRTNNSMNAELSMPPPPAPAVAPTPASKKKEKPKTAAEVAASGNDEEKEETGTDEDIAEIDKKAVADQFGLNLDQKGKIATLLQTGVLVMEPNLNEDRVITNEQMDKVKAANNRATVRIRFENVGVKADEEAERPGDDVVDEFLYLEEGLSIPAELIAKSVGAFNMDKKGRTAENVFYPDGLSQHWEIKVTTYVPLNLQLVCGKKEFFTGSGKDSWRILLPGAARDEEDVLYCHGICPDGTITNAQIQRAVEKLCIDVQGGNNGVKDSTVQVGKVGGGTLQTGRKYFFTNSKFQKLDDGTYEKLSVMVYSKVNKKEVQIRFTIRDKKMREEEAQKMEAKCKACGRVPPACTGADGVKCTYKDITIKDYNEKMKRLNKLSSIVQGGATAAAPKSKKDDVSETIVKYMNRLKKDSDEERAWRIKRLAFHSLQVEADKAASKAKPMDSDGFTKVEKQGPTPRRFTTHQPFEARAMRLMADFSGNFNNKDRLIATIYRWPSNKYDNDRARALAGMLNAKQMRDLVARIGVLDGKSPEEIAEMDAMENAERAKRLATWLHEFVEANVENFCKPIQK